MTPGTVSIVGAGPGDPELITVKARRRIESADVVFHDSLVSEAVVADLPESVRIEDVGKRSDGGRTPQAAINQRLVREAKAGRAVVRLKGGDPTVFARGGEEAQYLAAHEVPFEIIPGVSSVQAVPVATGAPLTHREHASSLTVVTGHEDPTKAETAIDWPALARTVDAGGTLVILMGVGRLPDNVEMLLKQGLSPETPVAVIEQATLPDEFSITTTLESVVSEARATGIAPPALVVVGDVVDVGKSVADWLAGTPTVQAVGNNAAPSESVVEDPQ